MDRSFENGTQASISLVRTTSGRRPASAVFGAAIDTVPSALRLSKGSTYLAFARLACNGPEHRPIRGAVKNLELFDVDWTRQCS